ncbi:MAG: hypothetical protein KZQ56_06525, partial [gamma proteobacterium symbiont of Lucinoma myriamae]|nr:hypothetical protein [gamma proteobacterium symbiont of Lucinoma myriamae]
WLDTIYIAVILLQGTYTPLVYAHDGRTQIKQCLTKTSQNIHKQKSIFKKSKKWTYCTEFLKTI